MLVFFALIPGRTIRVSLKLEDSLCPLFQVLMRLAIADHSDFVLRDSSRVKCEGLTDTLEGVSVDFGLVQVHHATVSKAQWAKVEVHIVVGLVLEACLPL